MIWLVSSLSVAQTMPAAQAFDRAMWVASARLIEVFQWTGPLPDEVFCFEIIRAYKGTPPAKTCVQQLNGTIHWGPGSMVLFPLDMGREGFFAAEVVGGTLPVRWEWALVPLDRDALLERVLPALQAQREQAEAAWYRRTARNYAPAPDPVPPPPPASELPASDVGGCRCVSPYPADIAYDLATHVVHFEVTKVTAQGVVGKVQEDYKPSSGSPPELVLQDVGEGTACAWQGLTEVRSTWVAFLPAAQPRSGPIQVSACTAHVREGEAWPVPDLTLYPDQAFALPYERLLYGLDYERKFDQRPELNVQKLTRSGGIPASPATYRPLPLSRP
jgi:hypothetical protein